MKFCKDCSRNVQPTKKFSVGWFIVNCLWLIGGVVYIFYFLFAKKKVCPICGGDRFEHSHSNSEIDIEKGNIEASSGSNYDEMVIRMKEDRASGKDNVESLRMKALASEVSENKKAERKADWDKLKAINIESKRKRTARELPWQIKADAKKLAKEQKKLNKTT